MSAKRKSKAAEGKAEDSRVEIFADGSCKGNPGPGGYAAILRYRGHTKEISGCERDTTNNRMELRAVIEALKRLKRPCHVMVVTDSNYVIKGMTQWLSGWVKRGWVNAEKKPVLNRDLWEKLQETASIHRVQWVWVPGHRGHAENERCDSLAKEAITGCFKSKVNDG